VLEKILNTATLILLYPRLFHVRRTRLLRRHNILYCSRYYRWKKESNEQQKLDRACQLYKQLGQKLLHISACSEAQGLFITPHAHSHRGLFDNPLTQWAEHFIHGPSPAQMRQKS